MYKKIIQTEIDSLKVDQRITYYNLKDHNNYLVFKNKKKGITATLVHHIADAGVLIMRMKCYMPNSNVAADLARRFRDFDYSSINCEGITCESPIIQSLKDRFSFRFVRYPHMRCNKKKALEIEKQIALLAA